MHRRVIRRETDRARIGRDVGADGSAAGHRSAPRAALARAADGPMAATARVVDADVDELLEAAVGADHAERAVARADELAGRLDERAEHDRQGEVADDHVVGVEQLAQRVADLDQLGALARQIGRRLVKPRGRGQSSPRPRAVGSAVAPAPRQPRSWLYHCPRRELPSRPPIPVTGSSTQVCVVDGGSRQSLGGHSTNHLLWPSSEWRPTGGRTVPNLVRRNGGQQSGQQPIDGHRSSQNRPHGRGRLAGAPGLPVRDDGLLWLAPPSPPTPGARRSAPGWLIGLLLLVVSAVAATLVLATPAADFTDEAGVQRPPPTTGTAAAASPTADLTVAATTSGVLISDDRASWRSVPGGPRLVRVAAGGGMLVGMGSSSAADYPDSVYTSGDGVEWSLELRVTEARLADVVHDNAGWLVVGTSVLPSITGIPIWSYRSPDGKAWSATSAEISQDAPVGLRVTSLAYGNGQWILGASGESSTVTGDPDTASNYVFAVSDDGVTWRDQHPCRVHQRDGVSAGTAARGVSSAGRCRPPGLPRGDRWFSVGGKRASLTTLGPVTRVEPEGLLVSTLTWVETDGHWLATGAAGPDPADSALYASDDLAHWDMLPSPAEVPDHLGGGAVAVTVTPRREQCRDMRRRAPGESPDARLV